MSKQTIPPLQSYDDIFGNFEDIRDMPIADMLPFRDHPYRVDDDSADMISLIDSIRTNGVLTPALVRPASVKGKYEIVSGHRRRRACELAGLVTMPAIIRDIDDDTATIMMVDANLQRDYIAPSERAFAYKMKLDAMKRQGYRADLTSRQLVGKSETAECVADNESGRQVQRYIRLTYLISPIMQLVDDKKLALNTAVDISYLSAAEQEMLRDAMDANQTVPSMAQAQQIKKASQAGALSELQINHIMQQSKKDTAALALPGNVISQYFPACYTPRQQKEIIISLLAKWARKQGREAQ